jgi:23S rRNA (adenine1618-N6)-methyltransferase
MLVFEKILSFIKSFPLIDANAELRYRRKKHEIRPNQHPTKQPPKPNQAFPNPKHRPTTPSRHHEIRKVLQSSPIDQTILTHLSIDFNMCNPPFYSSKADMLTSAATKQRPPFTACTGSESEMVTLGGEVAFVSRMITESLALKDRVQWYTSMLGKFSSVSILIQKLREHSIGNYAVTEFVQGSRTKRWGIAWSFEDLKPKMGLARGVNSVPKNLLPFPSEYQILVSF